MWLIDHIATGFDGDGLLLPFELFRILFGACSIGKFASDTYRGHFNQFRPHTYLYFFYRIHKPKVVVSARAYKIIFVLRFLGSIAFFLGLAPRVSLAVIVVGFLVEVVVFFRFYGNLMFLLSVCLFCAPIPTELSLPALLSKGWACAWSAAVNNHGSLFGQALIVATMSIMYFSAGYRKLNPEFLSGAVVEETVRFFDEEHDARRHFGTWYPRWIAQLAVRRGERPMKVWPALMWFVALLELGLPVLLLCPESRWVGVVAGIAMHAGFTYVYPSTVIQFTAICASSYVLFFEPTAVVESATRLLAY